MVKNITFLFVLAVILISCGNNKSKEIIAKGVIIDSVTNKPIPNARVTILCWREVGHDEESYDKVDTIANGQGAFEVKFNDGFKLDIGSIASNYHPNVQQVTELAKALDIKLKLKANTATGLLKNVGQLAVFAREYEANATTGKSYYGINILNGSNTQSLDSIDIGIQRDAKINYPKVLITHENGGLLPIFNNSGNDVNKAPEDGYVNEYRIKGNEKGFFIRCRDGKTYARLLIFSLEYDRSSPSEDGNFKDYGIMFNIQLQTDGNEFNSSDSLRLDHYILENI